LAIDREYLRQHYASLSDEALAALDRNDLVEAAQKLYDEERARRGMVRQKSVVPMPAPAPRAPVAADAELDEDAGVYKLPDDTGGAEPPAWIDGAACAISYVDSPGTDNSPEAANARDVLRAAGIPCYMSVQQQPPNPTPQRPQVEYRVLVPGGLNLKAQSILDKEVFNPQMEAEWRALFEELSDETLSELSPEIICAGLADRIERLTRIYQEELERRKSDADAG
jgi:hypothetical protein